MRVLGVWAACTLLTLVLARLGAQDTPATPWGGSAPSWLEHMAFWDAGWYERILTEGYPSVLPASAAGVVQQNTWAFMPLLPLLAAASSSVTGLPFYASAALVSLTASAAAALGLDRWLAPRAGARQSLWAVALVWSSPCALVLQTPYAEALGLALTAAALGLAHRRRFLIAAPIAALACLSRPIGVPLAAALGLWWAWETACARGLVPDAVRALLPGARPLTARRRLGLLGLTAWTGAAALVWPAAAWAVTGRADAYTATETAWRGERLAPFQPWLTRGAGAGGAGPGLPRAAVAGADGVVLVRGLCDLSPGLLRSHDIRVPPPAAPRAGRLGPARPGARPQGPGGAAAGRRRRPARVDQLGVGPGQRRHPVGALVLDLSRKTDPYRCIVPRDER